jgi:hypothetical protein
MATIYKDGEFVEENWVRADAETGTGCGTAMPWCR